MALAELAAIGNGVRECGSAWVKPPFGIGRLQNRSALSPGLRDEIQDLNNVKHFAKTIILATTAATLAGIGMTGAMAQNDVLNIPEDIQFIGNSDPNMRRATARVNGNIITGTDVNDRVALIIAANEVQIPEDELQSLRLQVLSNLIDETLQVQEAAALEMEVTADDVENAYNTFAMDRFGRTPEEMEVYLQSIGSSPRTLKRQIQGELAYRRLLQRNVAPFVNVSAAEVNELMDRLAASRGEFEYRIGEIYLSANDTNRDTVLANANQIVDRLRNGGSFVAYARQFSEASTAGVGGDLGWIRLEQLQNPTLEGIAREMSVGQLAGPVEIPGGYSLMLLIDRRQIGMTDPRDSILHLKQISIDFPEGLPESEAQLRAEQFGAGIQAMTGCEDANERAEAMGAEVVDNERMIARDLPDVFANSLLTMNLGESTPPFGSLDEGVRVLMLCGREEPVDNSGPDFDDIMAQMEDERINRRAQRYMRDLRRDAVIEYN